MKILEAFGEPISYGGQEAFVMNVIENMDRSGMEFDLLSPYYCDNEIIADKMRELGGAVYALGCDFRPGCLRNNAAGPIRDFLRDRKYDAVHIHSGSNSMLAMLARISHEEGAERIIVHSHCTGVSGLRHFASKTITSHALTHFPTDYLACSREAGEWRFPPDICREKLHIINNGINTEKFRFDENIRAEMRAMLGAGDDTVIIGNVGRLTFQKNQAFLIDVMEEVIRRTSLSQNGGSYKLLLIGDGEDRSMLDKVISAKGLSDHVVFTGTVDNVADYLQAMDVVAMPSRYEGLAIAVIEAQAAGLEVIASDAIPEAAGITDGVKYLPLSDKSRWADEIMKEHHRHPEQAEQVAANGYDIASTAAIVRNIYLGNHG